MKQITVDLGRMAGTVLPPSGERQRLAQLGRRMSAMEQRAIQMALSRAGSVGSLARDVMRVGEVPHSVRLMVPAALPFRVPSGISAVTVGLGLSGNLLAGVGPISVGASGGFGLYGSTTPEIGYYSTLGVVGASLGVRASAGGLLSLVFGPPSTFAGWFITPGISVNIGTTGVSVSGYALLSPGATGPFPGFPMLVGFAVGLGAGVSALPVTFSLEFTYTWTGTLWRPRP